MPEPTLLLGEALEPKEKNPDRGEWLVVTMKENKLQKLVPNTVDFGLEKVYHEV